MREESVIDNDLPEHFHFKQPTGISAGFLSVDATYFSFSAG